MTAAERLDQIERRSLWVSQPALVAALRAVLKVTADSLTEYPDDITALAVNRAIAEHLS